MAKQEREDGPLLTRIDVAVALGISRSRVRQLEDAGRIVPSARTVAGVRLFTRGEVDRFTADRKRRAAESAKRTAGRRG